MVLRADLTAVVERLVAEAKGGAVSLDDLGDAVGTLSVTTDEIDVMIRVLERQGIAVTVAQGGAGERHLGLVIAASRALRAELGRPPRVDEVAERARLAPHEVRHALSLARIMQR